VSDIEILGPETSALPVSGILAQNPASSPNIYRPYLMKVADLRDETPDVRTLRLEFVDPAEAEKFDFRVGQFGLYSALGEGESTFCIASASTRKGYIECTFRQAGRVTRALRRLGVGDEMGFRGPYGNSFPVEAWKGKDLLFIAGGIALPPMRSVIQYCLDKRSDYGDITIIYGARTWSDHVYKDELAEWEKRSDVNLWLCIDWKGGPKGLLEEAADEGWRPLNLKNPGESQLDPAHRRYTGFVPHLVEAVKTPPANRVAVLCGPPVMINFTLLSLKKLGYESQNVYTTLENRMKCGLGKCGRCNVGPVYVCKEGPVFTAKQLESLPPEM
jgi:NAD(P)H-flavin reductase